MRVIRVNHRIESGFTDSWLTLCFKLGTFIKTERSLAPWHIEYDEVFQSVRSTNVAFEPFRAVQIFGGDHQTVFKSLPVSVGQGEEIEFFLGASLPDDKSERFNFFLRWLSHRGVWSMWPIAW